MGWLLLCLLLCFSAEVCGSDDVKQLREIARQLFLDEAAGVTVSGVSSGGYMAAQMHIAFSSVVNGAAVFAGGPFYCAHSNIVTAERQCMAVEGTGPDVEELVAFSRRKEALRQIDSLQNLRDDRVYLFSATADSVVDPQVVKALEQYYTYFMPPENVTTDYDLEAEHCLPTLAYGADCMELASPYLGRCQVDGAGRAITALYGSISAPFRLKPELKPPSPTAASSQLLSFDQTPYFQGERTSLDTIGFIYIPRQCHDGRTKCRLHVSYHGCLQGRTFVGDQYAFFGGFNEWADTNDLVILYPNAKADKKLGNPNGCWDWWSYTDLSYGLHNGVQMSFSKSLIDSLFGKDAV